MGQKEVLFFLINNKGKKYSAKQISNETKDSYSSVATACRKLKNSGEIRSKVEYNRNDFKRYSEYSYWV